MDREALQAQIDQIPETDIEQYWAVVGITAYGSIPNDDGEWHSSLELACQGTDGLITKIGVILSPQALGHLIHVAADALSRSIPASPREDAP